VTNRVPEDRLAAFVASYPNARMALLPALRFAGQQGEITEAVVALVARLCQSDVSVVQDFLHVYPSLCGGAPKPVLCTGLVCLLRGARRIAEDPEAAGLRDGQFELTPCLGYCFAAPVFRDAGGSVHHLEPPAVLPTGLTVGSTEVQARHDDPRSPSRSADCAS